LTCSYSQPTCRAIRQGSDIDNRLKTLFDAPSMPANDQQVPPNPDVEPDNRVFWADLPE